MPRLPRPVSSAALALSLVLAGAGPVRGQVRAGPEFRVNTSTVSAQARPDLAVAHDGEFVVVWTDLGQDAGNVMARLYDDDGGPRTGEFRVNTYTTFRQEGARVAANERGFVVAWTSALQDGDGAGVFARRYDYRADPMGGDFQVSAYTTNDQVLTGLAMSEGGAAVVVWQDELRDGASAGVFLRRLDSNGTPVGADFQANTVTAYNQTGGRAAMAADGRFVVAWNSYQQDGSYHGVFARAFTSTGVPLGPEFQVNQTAAGDQYFSDLAMGGDGRFVVTWFASDGNGPGVWARRYDAGGNPLGGEFLVNATTAGPQDQGSVALGERGDFVITWRSGGQDGDQSGVFGQRFDKAGNRIGAEFQVNTYTTDAQDDPVVASDDVNNFIVAWSSLQQDGSQFGVYAQRFGGIRMTAMDVDRVANVAEAGIALASDGNGVLEPGETVGVETHWTNVNNFLLQPTATIPAFTGPPGGTYTVIDGAATFPPIPAGATRSCREAVPPDCYEVGVSAPARPLLHWDGRFEEAVGDIILGQAKLWDMHVGDSFTDVPRSNGFYRFVETLLHRGVTGGCGGTLYCPASSTSREQMAVFVLVAAEGPRYAPPPCVPPNLFADVPESSPFCRWIEELANRGVVAGCGGGNYCPGDPVSREQMAVFVLRTQDAQVPPACAAPNTFADVPETSPFCRWIEELARRGIVTGCGGGNYCPTQPVTREQMGVFIAATFELTLYGP